MLVSSKVNVESAMDPDALKVILESHAQVFWSSMEVIVNQFESMIATLEAFVRDLTMSLEFTQTEVLEQKGEIKLLRKNENEYKTRIEELNQRIQEQETRLNYQEDYSRRNILRVSGVKEQSGDETLEQTASLVSTLLQDKLQLPALNLERAHRVGPVVPSRPRSIVMRFEIT